jgi:hypothetical protein
MTAERRIWWRQVARSLAAAAVVAVIATGNVDATVRVKQTLTGTVYAPAARGRARLYLKTASRGRFGIVGRRLPGGATLHVVVRGVKVGTFRTGLGGTGRIRFSSTPRGHDAFLGFDPRGALIAIRNEDGDDLLEGDLPDDTPDSLACCLSRDGKAECEDLTVDRCAAAGGTTSAASCIPDPCGASLAPPREVVCCLVDAEAAMDDDAQEPECDEVSIAECAQGGGSTVEAASCDPDPCVPAAPPQVLACCVTEDGEPTCARLTPEHCSARQGTPTTASSCDLDPDPCEGGDDTASPSP